ncbi:MAG TPA: polyketide synthase, partial [Gemmatimonadaceae bacterium]|nr:polyketide synthase [Gemmatimonadaceae bacterium]
MANELDLQTLSPAKRALYELRAARARIEALERVQHEPIALIGMGLRFPGGASDPASLWRVLSEGQDTITEIPADRWDIEQYFDADPETPGKMYTKHGAFLDNVDGFDARFFGISPREATTMDPQQRLLLEVAWEALEHAGERPEQGRSATGVFVALSNSDYGRLVMGQQDEIDVYSSTGSNFSVAAGRLSYFLGLSGPSMVVDSACSGSLVAVHLACQSLRAGECRVALAGGVNLILTPEININFSKARMMAKD